MEKHKVSDTYYYVLSKDYTGETIRTNVFYKKEDDVYEAFSSYENDVDEDITGYGENVNDEKAIKLSIQHLHKEWNEFMKANGMEDLPFIKNEE